MSLDPKTKEKDILNDMLVSIGKECDRVKVSSENLAMVSLVTALVCFVYGMYAQSYIFLLTFVAGGLWNWLNNVSLYHEEIADIIFFQFGCSTSKPTKSDIDKWVYSVLEGNSVLEGKGSEYWNMCSELNIFYESNFIKRPFKLNIPTRIELEDAMKLAHPENQTLSRWRKIRKK